MNNSKTKFCPNCGKAVDINEQRCPYCGYQFQNTSNRPKPVQTSRHSHAFAYLVGVLIVIMLVLGGVYLFNTNHHSMSEQNSSSNTRQSQSKTTQNSSQKSSEEESHSQEQNNASSSVNWDSDKASDFADQFDDWADKMDQSYRSGSTIFDGVSYPDDFQSEHFIINGSRASVSMADSNRNTEYKVVEIRHDNDDGYLYLFAFDDGNPIVLFTESGDAHGNTVSFKTTTNKDLQDMFNNFSAN